MNITYSYRIEKAMAINLSSTFDMKNDIIIQRKMICAIHLHRKAMELVFILWYLYITNTGYYQDVGSVKL